LEADIFPHIIENKMGLFDHLVANAPALAEKTGVTPDKVRSIFSTLEAKLDARMAFMDAVERTAKEYDIPLDQFHNLLALAGSEENPTSNLGSLFSGLIKRQSL
jgi:hypothetical protein